MVKPRWVAFIVSLGLAVSGYGIVFGQNYPNKPIRVITSGAGGGNDFLSRLIAQGIAAPLGQPVVVENRANQIIAVQGVSQAPADGYTLLFASGGLWILPLIQKTTWDAVKDFAPISMIVRAPNILVVHPSLPVKSVKELIVLAKAKPGALNYGISGTASSSHLAGELFKSMAAVNILPINYKSSGPLLNAVIAGEVQLTFANATIATPHIKSGKLRALAVTTPEPSPRLPGMTTVAAAGVPGYESATIDGMFAPAKTPGAIINRLYQEIVRFLNQAEVTEKLQSTGVDVVGSSPEQFSATIKSEIVRMGKVVKDADIRVD